MKFGNFTSFPFAAFFLALVLPGCGGDGNIPVTGKVTLDGAPLESGSVQFYPVDGKSATTGAVIKNGEYATHVPSGKMRVEIRSSKVVGQRKEYDTPDSPMVDILAEAVPPQYNTQSTLTADIAPDMPTLNFELKSK